MKRSADTLFRLLTLLQKIPHSPQRKSTSELVSALRADGFELTVRTLQRDLNHLSAKFPLLADTEGKVNYWCWSDRDKILQIPTMLPSTALAFKLARDYLQPLLPTDTLYELTPYFMRADEVLSNTTLADWSARVRTISKGPLLQAPKISSEVQHVIYTALLEAKQCEVTYQALGKTDGKVYLVNPLALVIRDQVIYLLATFWDYDDVRQLALHRIQKAQLCETPVQPVPGFDLDDYIKNQQGFAYPILDKQIRLKVRFSGDVGQHLYETPLSEDQVIKKRRDGEIEVTATVRNTYELLWWLLSFGEYVEVIQPYSLRKKLGAISQAMYQKYRPAQE